MIISIILLALGAISSTFGYLIYVKKRYDLINDYEYKHNSNKKTYAERIGKIELIAGISLIILGIIILLI